MKKQRTRTNREKTAPASTFTTKKGALFSFLRSFWVPKWAPKWTPGCKIDAKLAQGGSQGAPGGNLGRSWGHLADPCHFGTLLGHFRRRFCKHAGIDFCFFDFFGDPFRLQTCGYGFAPFCFIVCVREKDGSGDQASSGLGG